MDIKAFFQRIWTYLTGAWKEGKIQRNSRITYDVFWNIILFFIIVGLTVTVFGIGTGAGYFASLVKDEPIRDYESMKNDIYNYEETTKVYFADDKYLGDIRAELYREDAKLDDVSDILVDAVISTEDELFYEHQGVVPKAIVRAIYQEAMNSDTKTGGSTLTQQLIKNQLLTNEVSFDRKAKEILLAMRLEHFFDKDEIMEAYLNIIPYGRNASGKNIAGIQTASKGVFGEDAKDLNIAQAAFLAGIPKNPYAYTPFTNKGEVKDEDALKLGKNRMKVVLKRMYKQKVITEEEYDDALAYDIEKDFTEKSDSPSEKYPAVVDELERRAKDIILEQLAEKDGITMDDIDADDELKENYKEQADRALRRNGYHIHSTINKDMYEAMDKVGKNYEYYGPDYKGEPVEAGAVLMENNSGRILSFYPGREYKTGGNEINYATYGKRPPGSTIKPLSTYAPGMDLGEIQPGSVVADIPRPNNHPKNYGGGFYGLVSAREALTHSYNVATSYFYEDIMDQDIGKNYLAKMGFDVDEDHDTGISLGYGSLHKGVTVEQNTSAFTTFGNGGKHEDSYMIEKITDSEGNAIYEHESDAEEVFSPQTTYLTIDMLRDVVKQGTAASLTNSGRLKYGGVDWAGKTGTSNDYKDAWFIGTNPNVTLGTWIGYDDPSSIYCANCSLSYSQRNQYLWADFVNALSDIDKDIMAPQDSFKQPENIVSSSYCASSGDAPSDICSDAGLVRSDIYNAKYVPSKKDDSLIGGKMPMVEVDGEQVIADEKTPSEFTTENKGGFTFNKDWIKKKGYDRLGDLSQLIPRKNAEAWKKVSAKGGSSSGSNEDIGEDDGKKPPQPGSVANKDGTITWDKSSGHLIVGYRIYRADKEGGSTKKVGSTTDGSYKVSDNAGVYYIKAVNYFGKESKSSKPIKLKDKASDKKDKEKKEKEKEKEKKKEKEKDKDSSENNNENNNNSNNNDNNNNDNNNNNDD